MKFETFRIFKIWITDENLLIPMLVMQNSCYMGYHGSLIDANGEYFIREINLRSIARSLLRWNVSCFLVNRIAPMQSKGENEPRYRNKHITLECEIKGQNLWTLLFKRYKRFHFIVGCIADNFYSFERFQYQWFIVQKFYTSAPLSTNKSMHKMSSAIANKANHRYWLMNDRQAKIIDSFVNLL